MKAQNKLKKVCVRARPFFIIENASFKRPFLIGFFLVCFRSFLVWVQVENLNHQLSASTNCEHILDPTDFHQQFKPSKGISHLLP